VRSANWSQTTLAPMSKAKESAPATTGARIRRTPSSRSAQTFARLGILGGEIPPSSPRRERYATRFPPTSPTRIGEEGKPYGVSTSTSSPPSSGEVSVMLPITPISASATAVLLVTPCRSVRRVRGADNRNRRRGNVGSARGGGAPRLVPGVGSRSPLAADPGSLRDSRLGGHAAADPGRAGRATLRALARAVADRRVPRCSR